MQIKKFKDAVAKYGTDLSCAGPAKGLDESELMRLALLGEISINLPKLPSTSEEHKREDLVLPAFIWLDGGKNRIKKEDNALIIVDQILLFYKIDL